MCYTDGTVGRGLHPALCSAVAPGNRQGIMWCRGLNLGPLGHCSKLGAFSFNGLAQYKFSRKSFFMCCDFAHVHGIIFPSSLLSLTLSSPHAVLSPIPPHCHRQEPVSGLTSYSHPNHYHHIRHQLSSPSQRPRRACFTQRNSSPQHHRMDSGSLT